MSENRSILVFRTAQDHVISMLFGELVHDRVVCLCQENSIEKYKAAYPKIQFLSIHQNFFSYEGFIKAKIQIGRKKTVIIPSSSRNFSGFEEVFRICDDLQYEEMVLYNAVGEKKRIKNDLFCRVSRSLLVI